MIQPDDNLKPQITQEIRYSYKYSAYFCIAHSYFSPSPVLALDVDPM